MGLNIQDLKIDSAAFDAHSGIPSKHTTEGEDTSPPISWSGVPQGTAQLAVICHDPDAPLPWGFTHWLCYNIPAGTTEIPEGGGDQFTEGVNDMGNTGYNGPAPPPGHGTHHYYFWIYALDAEMDLEPGLNRHQLLEHLQDHIIEQNRVVGTYQR